MGGRQRLNNNDVDSDGDNSGIMGNVDSAYTSSPGVAVRQMK